MTQTWGHIPNPGASRGITYVDGFGFFGYDDALTKGSFQFSVNGSAWVNRSLGDSDFAINDIAGSESLDVLVAVGFSTSGECILSSSDGGSTWTTRTSPWDVGGKAFIGSVAWSESLALFVCSGTSFSNVYASRVATSPDGVTWTGHTAGWGRFDGVDGGMDWVDPVSSFFLGDQFGGCWTSPDGVIWTEAFPSGFSIDLFNEFTYLAGVGVVAAVENDPKGGFAYSANVGVTWTEVTFAKTGVKKGKGVNVYGGRVYLAGINGASARVVSSADVVTWDIEFGPFTGRAEGVASSAFRIASVVKVGADYQIYFSYTPVVGAVTPLWRFFVADLDGFGITDFSKLASQRSVEVVLNGPLSATGQVPSDDPQVWIPYDGDGYDDPYLAEGTRILWGFRRESNTPPYYTVRAATLVQLVEDAAEQDDARTSFTAWDPWHYLLSRPVVNADGDLPGKTGLSYTNTQASVIIAQLLRNTIDFHGFAYVDAGTTYSGSSEYAGTLETAAGMAIDIIFQQGTTVGQAWQQITDLGVCDIILSPIYDPSGRSFGSSTVYNYLCELNVYAQAGVTRDEQIFAWNMPGRSLVGLSRQEEGSVRANNIEFFAGQGGSYGKGVLQTDVASEAKYGQYWAQQFFPGEIVKQAVTSLAAQQLELRKNGRETVTFSPAPERSPRPWQDYQLGDKVPVWASQTKFRKLLGATGSGSMQETQYQRLYGWRANISDDALETIDPVLTSPQGGFTG